MSTELFSTGEVAEIVEMPAVTIKQWTGRVVEPRVPARGTGRQRMFDVKQVWAIEVGKSLRKAGLSLDIAAGVAEVLDGLDQDEIDQAFGEDPPRDSLLAAGTNVAPMLFAGEALTDNPEIRQLTKHARREGLNIKPIVINVKMSWDQVVKQIRKLRKSQR